MCDLAEDFGAPSLSISKGRAILTPGLADKLKSGPKFIIRTVSNINKEIRVVAVCGIIDVEEMLLVSDWEAPPDAPELYQEAGQADPSADGWSFSDFYAFRHLLKDIGAAAQFWIVSEPPRELVQRYTAYLHANPYYDRKVVLNADLFDQWHLKLNALNPTRHIFCFCNTLPSLHELRHVYLSLMREVLFGGPLCMKSSGAVLCMSTNIK